MGAHTLSTAPQPIPSRPPMSAPSPGLSRGLGGNPPCSHVDNLIPITYIKTEMEGITFYFSSLITDGVRPPRNSKGGICLSYKFRFSCFIYCASRGSHWPLTSQEKTDMCLWFNDNVFTPKRVVKPILLLEVTAHQLSSLTLIVGLTLLLFLPFYPPPVV